MTKLRIILFMTLCCLFRLSPSYAADSYTVGTGASITITEHTVCAVVTNTLSQSLFVPTKSAAEWASFRTNTPAGVTSSACPTGPTGCPNIGNICSDNTIYLGTNLYITDRNQGGGDWATSEVDDTGAENVSNGEANVAWIKANRNIDRYPAIKTCDDLVLHGHSDWYLPASNELKLAHTHRSAINVSSIEPFVTFRYWTSNNYSKGLAYMQNFGGSGNHSAVSKDFNSHIRCVRRHP